MSTWLCVAPVAPYWWDHVESLPLEMASAVKLMSLPDWVASDEALAVLSLRTREKIREASNVALAVEYEATAHGDPDPNWRGREPRSVQEAALEAIVNASMALWISKPSAFGFEAVLHFDRPGDPRRCRAFTIEPLRPAPFDLEGRLSIDDVTSAREMHGGLQSLEPRSAVWMASRLLWKAFTERTWEMRLLFLWVGLEALYGPNSGQETTHQLAERIALLLGTDRDEARQLYRTAKQSYRWRSKIAHGNRTEILTREKFGCVLHDAENLLRRTLRKIVLDGELLRLFNSAKRDDFLSGLMFERLGSP